MTSMNTGRMVLGGAALALAVAHLASLILVEHSLLWVITLVVMSLWCIKCAWGVMRGGCALKLLLMSAGMGIVHVAMAVGLPWFSDHHQGHTTHAAHGVSVMLAIALAEFAVMFLSALVVRQANRQLEPVSMAEDLVVAH